MSAADPGKPRAGAGRWIASGLFAGGMFLSALVLGLLCLPLMLGPRRGALVPARLWAKSLFFMARRLLGLRVAIHGRERLPQGGGYLVAAKHQGMLDILVAIELLDDPCIVLKRELMWIPIFGWYAWKARMIPIDRGGGSDTIRAMLAAARVALAEGRQVLLYPEGTRREPGAPPAYKGGVGILYKELEAPCALMACDSGRVWPAHGLVKHKGVATFEVLEVLAPGLSRAAFMRKMQSGIEDASDALLAMPVDRPS